MHEFFENSHRSSEIVKRRLSQIFGHHSERDYHSLQMAGRPLRSLFFARL
jgi:hypothetical protein